MKAIWAATYDFQQCGILTWIDSDEPVQSPFKLRNSKWCSISSQRVKVYSSDQQTLWSDCAYAQAGLSLCWSHIPHCWKSHATAQMKAISIKKLKQLQKQLWSCFYFNWLWLILAGPYEFLQGKENELILLGRNLFIQTTFAIKYNLLWLQWEGRTLTLFLIISCQNLCSGSFKTHKAYNYNWAETWDIQQCGMCSQQSLRSACIYPQSDQSLC